MASSMLTLLLLGIAGVEAAVSTTGRCGRGYGGVTCAGSVFGNCCSSKSWCGATSDYCGTGCQTAYGTCGYSQSPKAGNVSKDGRCGLHNGNQICNGSQFGDCCSQYGYCGRNKDYCDAKTCQKSFGTCDGALPSSTARTTLSSVIVPSSSAAHLSISAVQPTCSALTITLPPLPASTVTVPGEEVTVTVTATAKETVTVPGEVSTVISTIVETATEAPTCSEGPISTTIGQTSISSSVPAIPIPSSFCLRVASPDLTSTNWRVVYTGTSNNYWLSEEINKQPVMFTINELNQLLTTNNGAVYTNVVNAANTSFSNVKWVDQATSNLSTYGPEYCTVRTDIAGYEGRQILRCSASIGGKTFEQFVAQRPGDRTFLAAVKAGTPSEAGMDLVEMAIATSCPYAV